MAEHPGERAGHQARLVTAGRSHDHHQPPATAHHQRGGRRGSLGDHRVDGPRGTRAVAVAVGAGHHHLVRAGQAQAEPLPPGQQVADTAAAGEQVFEELAALRLFPAGHRQVGLLEPARGRGHRVVGGPQHGQPGGAQRFAPQPPGRGQVQVDQAAQRDPALRGLLPRSGVLGQFRGGQAAATARRVQDRGQVAAEQPGRDPACLAARRPGDRGQVHLAVPAARTHSRHRLPAGPAASQVRALGSGGLSLARYIAGLKQDIGVGFSR